MLRLKKTKKEDALFQLFIQAAEKIATAAETFSDLVHHFESVEDKVSRMKIIETECDLHVHRILKTLHESAETPFDREDIYELARNLDDIVDCMEEAANRFLVFGVDELKYEALQMTDLILTTVRELQKLFISLPEIKTNNIVKEQVIEVNRLENEGDIVYRKALTKLFREEKDPIEIIKWKDLFGMLEDSLDACENVANTVEGLVMKHV